jgi:hypothetical protein
MGEPNLDLGLEYTGGIEKPLVTQVGYYARVALDALGAPNLEYVSGVERRVFYTSPGSITGTLAKTTLAQTFTIPANTMLDSAKRIRVMIYGEVPARPGTLIGLDTFAGGVSSTLQQLSISGTPLAASAFVYELIIFPATSATQRIAGRLTCDQVAVKTGGALTTIDMTVDQRIDVTAQLANVADTVTFRRVEVWQLT